MPSSARDSRSGRDRGPRQPPAPRLCSLPPALLQLPSQSRLVHPVAQPPTAAPGSLRRPATLVARGRTVLRPARRGAPGPGLDRSPEAEQVMAPVLAACVGCASRSSVAAAHRPPAASRACRCSACGDCDADVPRRDPAPSPARAAGGGGSLVGVCVLLAVCGRYPCCSWRACCLVLLGSEAAAACWGGTGAFVAFLFLFLFLFLLFFSFPFFRFVSFFPFPSPTPLDLDPEAVAGTHTPQLSPATQTHTRRTHSNNTYVHSEGDMLRALSSSTRRTRGWRPQRPCAPRPSRCAPRSGRALSHVQKRSLTPVEWAATR